MRAWSAASVVAMVVYAGLLASGRADVAWFVKPLPVALLAAGVLSTARAASGWWLGAGLVLSAVADVAIEVQFLAGLGVFLVAHLTYIVAFTVAERRPAWGRAVPFVALAVGTGLVFVPAAQDLGVPVAVYSCAIAAMGWRAAARLGVDGGLVALVGALSFMLSDSLLAVDRFVTPLPYRTLLVMGTYWLGQLLIAQSVERSGLR